MSYSSNRISRSNKILIVGSTCTGKTTTAKILSKILKIEVYDLDDFYWKENWIQQEDTKFKEIIFYICEREKWIIDSVYLKEYFDLYRKADIVIWLDINFISCLLHLLKRSIMRSIEGKVLCNNNKETFVRNFLNKNSVILALILDFRKHKKKYLFDPQKKVIRLCSFIQLNEWISKLNNTAPN